MPSSATTSPSCPVNPDAAVAVGSPYGANVKVIPPQKDKKQFDSWVQKQVDIGRFSCVEAPPFVSVRCTVPTISNLDRGWASVPEDKIKTFANMALKTWVATCKLGPRTANRLLLCAGIFPFSSIGAGQDMVDTLKGGLKMLVNVLLIEANDTKAYNRAVNQHYAVSSENRFSLKRGGIMLRLNPNGQEAASRLSGDFADTFSPPELHPDLESYLPLLFAEEIFEYREQVFWLFHKSDEETANWTAEQYDKHVKETGAKLTTCHGACPSNTAAYSEHPLPKIYPSPARPGEGACGACAVVKGVALKSGVTPADIKRSFQFLGKSISADLFNWIKKAFGWMFRCLGGCANSMLGIDPNFLHPAATFFSFPCVCTPCRCRLDAEHESFLEKAKRKANEVRTPDGVIDRTQLPPYPPFELCGGGTFATCSRPGCGRKYTIVGKATVACIVRVPMLDEEGKHVCWTCWMNELDADGRWVDNVGIEKAISDLDTNPTFLNFSRAARSLCVTPGTLYTALANEARTRTIMSDAIFKTCVESLRSLAIRSAGEKPVFDDD